jgi:hypothetical protein
MLERYASYSHNNLDCTLTRKITLAPTPPVAQYQLKARSAAGFSLTWHFITEDVLESKDYVEHETILNL